MNAKIAKRWVKALRSGKYKQGTGCLRGGDRFCCLGVLCDIHSNETGMEWSGNGSYLGSSGTIPGIIMQWSGLKSNDGFVEEGVSLSSENDYGASFSEIATIIEENVEKL